MTPKAEVILRVCEQAGEDTIEFAACAIADEMTRHGLDVLQPSHHLRVTNVPGMLCEVTMGGDGSAEWEYRPCHSADVDPAHIAQTVLHVLGGAGRCAMLPRRHRSSLTVKSMAGRILAEHGMRVSVQVAYLDQHFYEVYSEIEVTNPAQPGRGRVRVADDGSVHWQCHMTRQSGKACGPDAYEVAATIARALAGRDRE